MKKDRLQAYLLILIAIITICLCAMHDNFAIVRYEHIDTGAVGIKADTSYGIDINTASKDDLMTISGIGEVIADRILEYREEIGGFKYMEELLEVEGIGESKYQSIIEVFYVG